MGGTVLLALLCGLLLVLLSLRSHSRRPALKLPPGPWQLPIIGSVHHLLGNPLPFRAMRDLSRTHGPLMLLRLGEVPALVVSSPDAAREVLKTHGTSFASRHLSATLDILTDHGGGVLFAPYGDKWRQLRRVCVLELMSPRSVQSFRHIREEEVACLVRDVTASVATGGLVNLSEGISKLANNTFVRAAIGSRCKHQDEYLRKLKDLLRTAGLNAADLFPSSAPMRWLGTAARQARRCHDRIHGIMRTIIRERQAADGGDAGVSDREDFLGALLRLQREGGTQVVITTDVISAILFDLFAAGSETSATNLEWAMAELVRNPLAMEKAQAEVRQVLQGRGMVTEDNLGELKYLKLVIKEALRLHAPFPLVSRSCREACQVMGYDIPKGTAVFVNLWAIGRDPECWEDAEEFKPERFQNSAIDFKGLHFEFIPFGAGVRMCPGMEFGLANVELALANLLYHFDWEMPHGMKPQEMDISETQGMSARKRSHLRLRPIPRAVPTIA